MDKKPEALKYVPLPKQGVTVERSLLKLGAEFKLGEDIYSYYDQYLLNHRLSQTEGLGLGYLNIYNVLATPGYPDNAFGAFYGAFTGKRQAMVDGVLCDPKRPEKMKDLAWTAQQIGIMARMYPDHVPGRIFMPIAMMPKEGRENGHMLIAALEWNNDKAKPHFEVSLFEQHAKKDGGQRDFSREAEAVGSAIVSGLKRRNPGITAHYKRNQGTLCDKHKVCFVFAGEAIKTLAMADAKKEPPSRFLSDPQLTRRLIMDDDRIDEAHALNVQAMRRIAEPNTNSGRREGYGR